ncbi:MAG: cobalt transporter [Nitrospirales bacterium]|nr:cobalt transporter [Nitrospirales bacterium]
MAVFLLLLLGSPVVLHAEEQEGGKWGGVDESIVEKYAKEHGREAREPYINTDQGDLLLFVCLLGGTVGGFFAGYYWRTLMDSGPAAKERCVKAAAPAPTGEERT